MKANLCSLGQSTTEHIGPPGHDRLKSLQSPPGRSLGQSGIVIPLSHTASGARTLVGKATSGRARKGIPAKKSLAEVHSPVAQNVEAESRTMPIDTSRPCASARRLPGLGLQLGPSSPQRVGDT